MKNEQIDWSKLRHAYGEASDIPGLLRGLASNDADERWEALQGLCTTIWHQGTIYQATPHVVPYLLDMLRSPEIAGREGIALLVAEIADATSALAHFTDENDLFSRLFRDQLLKEGRDFDRELEDEKVYLQATHNAVGLGIELLYEYLTHEEHIVREGVARALARFPERAHKTIPLLEAAREAEMEGYVRETIDRVIVELRRQIDS